MMSSGSGPSDGNFSGDHFPTGGSPKNNPDPMSIKAILNPSKDTDTDSTLSPYDMLKHLIDGRDRVLNVREEIGVSNKHITLNEIGIKFYNYKKDTPVIKTLLELQEVQPKLFNPRIGYTNINNLINYYKDIT